MSKVHPKMTMNSSPNALASGRGRFLRALILGVSPLFAAGSFSLPLRAQDAPAPAVTPAPDSAPAPAASAPSNTPAPDAANGNGRVRRNGNFPPEGMLDRM